MTYLRGFALLAALGGLFLPVVGWRAPAKPTVSGTIAYCARANGRGAEIHLIEPDGSHDRRLWKVPNAAFTGVTGLAWRPDGKELAFVSDHAGASSLYESDIYALHLDGTEFRKLTNPPGDTERVRFPKGSMTVTLRNDVAGTNLFLVYVAGAEAAQSVVIATGESKTITVRSVADFGTVPHWIAAINGEHRWLFSGPVVHAGQTASTGPLALWGSGMKHFGATGLLWRSDGKRLGFVLAQSAGLFYMSPQPAPGSMESNLLLGGKEAIGASVADWGPNPALANQVLYGGATGDPSIYRTTEGSGSRGAKLLDIDSTEVLMNVQWLPDGSGFLFSKVEEGFSQGNIYRFDFATKKVTPLTHFSKEFAGSFSIAPDSQGIVFERTKSLESGAAIDLWTMRLDGSEMRLLAHNGSIPAWGRSADR